MDSKTSSVKALFNFSTDLILKEGLVFLTGLYVGVVLTSICAWGDTLEFWGMLGTMLAGIGTVGLLAFGLTTGSEWITKIKKNKHIDLMLDTSKNLINTSNILESYFHKRLYEYKPEQIQADNSIAINQYPDFTKKNKIEVYELHNQVKLQVKILISLSQKNIRLTKHLKLIDSLLTKVLLLIFSNDNTDDAQGEIHHLSVHINAYSQKFLSAIIDEEIK